MSEGWLIAPFWCGVVLVLGIEFALLIAALIVIAVRDKKEKKP